MRIVTYTYARNALKNVLDDVVQERRRDRYQSSRR